MGGGGGSTDRGRERVEGVRNRKGGGGGEGGGAESSSKHCRTVCNNPTFQPHF